MKFGGVRIAELSGIFKQEGYGKLTCDPKNWQLYLRDL